MNTKWTPLHIEIVMHYFCRADRMHNEDAPAVVRFTQGLIEDGILSPRLLASETQPQFEVTELGRAFIGSILSTPIPRRVYIGMDGKEVKLP